MAQAEGGTKLANGVALLKDAVAALRDLSLFLFAALLVVFPDTFNAILTRAGFEEGSLVGMKWKRGLVDTDKKLKLANDTITALTTQRDQLQHALDGLRAEIRDPAQRATLDRIDAKLEQGAVNVRDVQATVRDTLASNAPLVRTASVTPARAAPAPTVSERPPATGYCYQEDKLQPGPQRYGVHCFRAQAMCDAVRGPNHRTLQSGCEPVVLDGAGWSPTYPGYRQSWYDLRPAPFAAPFPPLPAAR